MTYEAFFESVKRQLWNYYEHLPEYKLLEYLKKEEDVIRDQYDYWLEQVEIEGKEVTQQDIDAMAGGATYSLYLLYEG